MKRKILNSIVFFISLTGCSLNKEVIDYSIGNNYKNKIVNKDEKIKNVIMFIGDGMGHNHVDVGGIYKGEPLVFDVNDDKWAYHALVNTDSLTSEGFTLDTSKSLIRPDENPSLYDGTPSPYDPAVNLGASGNITTYTDSAAGGTALATGEKTINSRIGLNYNGEKIENLVEIAKGLNKKAGVVSSDNLVGATPSSFLVHVGERHLESEIIKEASKSPADLILCQNVDEYKNNQSTYETLYKNNGFDISYNVNNLDKSSNRILGLFDGVVTRQDDPRAPSLKDLTVFALDYLDNEEGFFLMVEGANIDKKSHSNQTILMLKELLAFDEAIEACMEWASNRDDTIIVVTADHETGGLYYDYDGSTKETIIQDIKWLTYNHSRSRVDLAVYGDIKEFTNLYFKNKELLEGIPYIDNTDIFKLCSMYL